MKGFIKDYRQELDSDIWLMPPLYHRVWQYLKYRANHKENRIPMDDDTFLTIVPGQHLTSVRNIAKGVGYYEQMKWKEPNPKTVSKILEWLEKQSMISINRGKGNRQYTLISLSNWDSFQAKPEDGNSEGSPHGEGREHPMDIKKNDLECFKNDLEDSSTTNDDAIVFYQNNFGMLRPHMSEEILDWINDFGDEMVMGAMKRSLERNKPSWGYTKSILKSWQEKNIKSIDQAKAEEVEFQNKQSNKKPYYPKQQSQEIVPDWFKNRDNKSSDQPKQQKGQEEIAKEQQELAELLKQYS